VNAVIETVSGSLATALKGTGTVGKALTDVIGVLQVTKQSVAKRSMRWAQPCRTW
jgi:hypothetical protein